jgi:hypothetical protein
VNKDFFWLRAPQPVRGEKFNVECRGNDLTVTALPNVSSASVFLDARLIDFNQPVKLTVNGKKTSKKLKPSLLTLCASLQRRGDPGLAFSAELPLTVAAKEPKAVKYGLPPPVVCFAYTVPNTVGVAAEAPIGEPATVGVFAKFTTCAVLIVSAVVAVPPAVVVCNASVPSLLAVVFKPALPLDTPLSDRIVDGII